MGVYFIWGMKEGNRLENTSTTNSESKPSTQELVSRLEGFALASVLAALMLTLLLEALDQTVAIHHEAH